MRNSSLKIDRLGSAAIGDRLPTLTMPPLSRATLALYAGASGDHNPNHIDLDAARAAGQDDVFAHGMLVTAWLGRLLTGWAPPESIRSFDTRFTSMTRVGERITCSGEVVDRQDGKIVVQVQACNEDGEVKVAGRAVIAG
ncbi:MaoC/PaaZ C-terminal domain-containing protein [Noviherbaspirillum sp. ST9]|uniref:MaoC/PaaZ C-terminal domain-containing protein n=1 Tax=Noviherbaspirillum sp. ST9 TaxID=3401606 RepID=UPI003B588AEF